MFQGVYTALVTPFRDGEVDVKAMQAIVERQIDAGIDGLVPCGSTGESATLSHDEHDLVVKIVVEAAAGRVKVLAGSGSNNTQEAIALTKHAKEAGADGALLISPYYNKPTQEGIVGHFEAIAAAAEFPLVVYNVPGRTASNIAPETLARLSENEYIVGVKEACGNVDQIAHVVALCRDDFSVLWGDDALALPIIAVGGKGGICTSSNVAPELFCQLFAAAASGDLVEARRLHYKLLPLMDVLFAETNPIPVKAAVSLLGQCGDEIRLPMTPITPPTLARLQIVLKELELL